MPVFDKMKENVQKYEESGIPAETGLGDAFSKIIHFEIEGDAKPDFYLDIKGGKDIAIFEGKPQKADIVIASDKDTMIEVSTGKLAAMAAYMRGNLEVRGKHSDSELMKLIKIIFPSVK